MEKFTTDPGRTFIPPNGIKRKSHFLTSPSRLLLCDLEVDPKGHPPQLRLRDQLCTSPAARDSQPRFSGQRQGDQISKTRVPTMSYFYFEFYQNDFESDELPRLFWFCLVF